VVEERLDAMNAVHRTIVAFVTGACLSLLVLYGLALLIDHDNRTQQAKQVDKAGTATPGSGQRSKRMVTVVHAPRPRPAVPRQSRKKPPKPVEDMKGQVVETARPEYEKRTKQARYLGRYDMQVKRERKSRGRKRQGRDLGHVEIDRPSRIQSPNSKSKRATRMRAQKAASKQRKAASSRPSVDTAANKRGAGRGRNAGQSKRNFGLLRGGADKLDENQRSPVVRNGRAQMLLPATSPGNIVHNIQALAGNPGSDDYLPDVTDEGATNLLNTRKFRYWDFFQRVKDRVRGEWRPARVWNSRDPSGRRYGVRDRLTVVRVTLDPAGALRAVRVARQSGLSFLDDEAQRAFTAAGPYPNPPRGLINADGQIQFQFGFMFEISSARFKFYRMPR
jgi:TonB family protein